MKKMLIILFLLIGITVVYSLSETHFVRIKIENHDDVSHHGRFYINDMYVRQVYIPPHGKETFYYYLPSKDVYFVLVEEKCRKIIYLDYYFLSDREIFIPIEVGDVCPEEAKVEYHYVKYGKVTVSIINEDDDTLRVSLRRGYSTKTLYLKSGDIRNVTFNLPPEHYVFVISWFDPDKNEVQKLSKEIELGEGEEEIVTFVIPRKEVFPQVYKNKGTLTIIICNEDNNDLWVDLLLDSYAKTKFIKSKTCKYYGEYELNAGEHKVKLRWLDPDIYTEFSEKEFTVEVEKGRDKVVKFNTDSNP